MYLYKTCTKRMRSSLLVRASDCQCTSYNGPGFDSSIRRHSRIWGAADEAVLNIVRKKEKKISPTKLFFSSFLFWPYLDLAHSTIMNILVDQPTGPWRTCFSLRRGRTSVHLRRSGTKLEHEPSSKSSTGRWTTFKAWSCRWPRCGFQHSFVSLLKIIGFIWR